MIDLGAIDATRDDSTVFRALDAIRSFLQYLFARTQRGTATLINGQAVVPCRHVRGGIFSMIVATYRDAGGVVGTLYVPTVSRKEGLSFTVFSTNTTDTSTIDWVLVNP